MIYEFYCLHLPRNKYGRSMIRPYKKHVALNWDTK